LNGFSDSWVTTDALGDCREKAQGGSDIGRMQYFGLVKERGVYHRGRADPKTTKRSFKKAFGKKVALAGLWRNISAQKI